MRYAVLTVAAFLSADIGVVGAQRSRQSEPLPRPGVPALVEAFEDHRLVAIGEAHRNQQVHDFIVTLLRDRRFLPGGGDIVVEFGNARYQDVVDRYTAGEPTA